MSNGEPPQDGAVARPAERDDGATEPSNTQNWSDVIASIIPGEVTAVYLGIRSTVAMIGESGEAIGAYVPYALLGSIVLLTLVSPLYSLKIRKMPLGASVFIAFSFLIWAVNIDYNRMLELIDPLGSSTPYYVFSYLIPIALIVWGGLGMPVFAQLTKRAQPGTPLPATSGDKS